MKTIKSISEAFSQQPRTITMGDNLGIWDDPHILTRMEYIGNRPDGERIEGYDKDDKILFSYVANAVNIHYY